MRYKTGMLFGTFDRLHEGHRSFIRQALGICEHLIVVVAPDSTVMQLKGHFPEQPQSDRIRCLGEFKCVVVVSGDYVIGSGLVVKRFKPYVIFLGYDQLKMISFVEELDLPYVVLKPYKPDIYHSSIIEKHENKNSENKEVDSISSKKNHQSF